MMSYQQIAASLLLVTSVCLGARVSRHAQELESCSAATCVSFTSEDSVAGCSCLPYVNDPLSRDIVQKRAEEILYKSAQSLRYLSDYEGAEKSTLQKLWLPTVRKNINLLGTTMKDVAFLQGALEHVTEVQNVGLTKVKDLFKKSKMPAGAFSLMVEVWDHDMLSGNFIGEAGAPLLMGKHSYTLPLVGNEARNSETAKLPELGTVTFETDFNYDASKVSPCDDDDDETKEGAAMCTMASLTVTCKAAANLPNVDMFNGKADPYCKIRVKQLEDAVSTKQKTSYIDNQPNPEWTSGNVFKQEWATMLVEDASVPWTWDQMALIDQFQATTRLLAKHLVLDGKECFEIESKSKEQEKICKQLDTLDNEEVPEDLVSDVQAAVTEEEAQILEEMFDETKGASLLEAATEDVTRVGKGRIRIHVHHGGGRRHGGGRYGGHHYGRRHGRIHHGGHIRFRGPGEFAAFIIFCFFVVLLL